MSALGPGVENVLLPASLDAGFAEELSDVLERANTNPDVRVLAFLGREPNTFCRGLDLEQLLTRQTTPEFELAAVGRCLRALHAFEKPKLALIDGPAVGGGLGIAAACDWVVASERASFALPELLWGFVPAAILPLLIRRIGILRTQTLALTAVARTATEARTWGLVDVVVPEEELVSAARRAAKLLSRPDFASVCLLRSWSEEAATLPVGEAIERGARLTADWLGRDEVKARLNAFFRATDEVPWKVGVP